MRIGMRKEAWLEHNNARFIYYSYKDSPYFQVLIVTVILLISFFLIGNILIPQTENWFSIRDETLATKQRIHIIKSNIAAISSQNKNKLEENRSAVIRALPVEKDFGSIVNAIAQSSAKSRVSINDFTFGLGSISTPSASKALPLNSLDTTTLTLSLKGDIDAVTTFIKELEKKLPLSEVESVDTSEGTINVLIVFYSKPYRPTKIFPDKPISLISPQNHSLVDTLARWKADSASFAGELPIRSTDTPLF